MPHHAALGNAACIRQGMNAIAERLAPSVTQLIRADHTKVLTLFHRYRLASSPGKKAAIVASVCLLLEVHAQAEEEVFYLALRAEHPALVEKSVPEHDEMRQLIATLRGMPSTEEMYDRTFMELMRTVMHHVADEETTLLPVAERFFGAQLGALGARMMKRRMELMAPHAGEIALSSARAMPAMPLLFATGALLAGAWFARRRTP
jgi:hemerythrin superfamily protein